MNLFNIPKLTLPRSLLALSIAILCLFIVFVSLQTAFGALAANSAVTVENSVVGSSFLYRFDSSTNSFYTFTLPLSSIPYGIAVTGTNPTDVWVAESGRDRIGHLSFTNTIDVQWEEHPITSTLNSNPFQIALHGNYVWFTERGANRVGRLDATTGEIVEFFGNGLPSNAGLAHIAIAPNGWVWLTGESSDSIIRLVVTSTSDFSFTQYATEGPFGLAIESDSRIWFTAPTYNKIGRLSSINGQILLPFGFPTDSTPYEFVATPSNNQGWFSDPGRNAIGQLEIGTLTNLNFHGPVTKPFGLASESPTRLWFTQQGESGAVGRLIYTPTTLFQIDSYQLPTPGLRPTGIDVASDKGVWFGAFEPLDVLLPIVRRNF